jgi:hypothetical protein
MDQVFEKEWSTWNEADFEKYRNWCVKYVEKGRLICRECWHLHCHWDKCTIVERVCNICVALIDVKIFPKDICKYISAMIPELDKIS